MTKILLPIIIILTWLVIYWLLWAYFLWDIAWLADMWEISMDDRIGRLLMYLTTQIVVVMQFIPLLLKND